jgi:hypothetical protein
MGVYGKETLVAACSDEVKMLSNTVASRKLWILLFISIIPQFFAVWDLSSIILPVYFREGIFTSIPFPLRGKG